MVAKAKQALSRSGKLPCTLIILDEVQQYIGDNVERGFDIDLMQRTVHLEDGLFGDGRSHRPEPHERNSPAAKVAGRFPGHRRIARYRRRTGGTREVVLKKKPSSVATIKTLLENNSGEIERQLASTKIASTARDRQMIVQDYPILPVRRRFWERVLRAVDKAGTGIPEPRTAFRFPMPCSSSPRLKARSGFPSASSSSTICSASS